MAEAIECPESNEADNENRSIAGPRDSRSLNPTDIGTGPATAIVVCTRDRPTDAERAVRSLLASQGVVLEVIVVDQSEGDATARALALDDPRVRYIRNRLGGKSVSMNVGFSLARSDVVVCMDDDCEAPPGWVAAISQELRDRPEMGAVFSTVTAAPHDEAGGYIPHYTPARDRTLFKPLDVCRGWGMGAGMALRRSVVADLGGFDEAIGPGGLFGSGDDVDIELRLLLRGWPVYHLTRASTVHHGYRTVDQGSDHALRVLRGNGATMAKLLRCGHPTVLVFGLWFMGTLALGPPLMDVLHFRAPRGLRRGARGALAQAQGFVAGLRTPIDRSTMRFIVAST